MKKTWSPLQHKIFRELKSFKLEGAHIVVGFSAGMDSTVLLHTLSALSSALKVKVTALHVNHGLTTARDEAQKFAQEFCAKNQIPLEIVKNETRALNSEAELRAFRIEAFQKCLQKGADFVALAHHQEDLLETRLLRLIRGVGPEGLPSMKIKRGRVFRPLLSITKKEILNEAKVANLEYFEDPTNRDSKYLRNWLRHEWLPQLEHRAPGASKAMARSLELLSEKTQFPKGIWKKNAISYRVFQTCSLEQQKQVIASYLYRRGARDYRASHVKEILKHLDKARVEHTFQVAGFVWNVNAEQILAQP